MRQGEKSCPYYMQTGMCKFGVACKFHHPHPQPHNGHSTYGMSSFPSVGYPYAGGLTMMSLPPATYGVMTPPQVPQSQAYMPFMVAPSQGLLPPQGWPTYMAGSNPMYNVKTQPDSSSSASVTVAVTSHHQNYSDRAECRFFMNTGTCKYGDDCKYSHPKERMLHSPPNLSNPIALPARPGQPACGNFKAYGFCKYGANCKFDHSMPTANASPVVTHLRISSPPSNSDSTTNGNKPAAENHSSEIEKQEDISTQPDKSEVQDSSQPNHSDSTALSNGKPDAENPSSETKKEDENPVQPEKSEKQESSDNSS
ncbi:hypothetical protein EUTSA_v10016979mg [Eutrema salsugineum]|uniref:C3H1-type domain-containing protein n=2 Tax=Eutrema salsugineum TaxID=72664 RepID=V4MH40_EUTSA|nr:hypothetical protein EUTSA_v10016979mg [Eutrema salsugineum]